MVTSLAESVTRFVREYDLDDATHSTNPESEDAILDSLGVALLGAREVLPTIMTSAVQGSSRGDASIWGRAARARCTDAVLINSVAAHALDYDGVLPHGACQPCAVLVPALLGLAETRALAPVRIVRANAMGTELFAALGGAFGPELHASGWHPTAILGGVVTAAVCGRLLSLSDEEIQRAIGIAVSMASGVKRNFGTTSKALQVGESARGGILAAWLASRGATSDTSAPDVWLSLLLGRTASVPALGAVPHGRLHLKKYPCCGRIHCAIDASLNIRMRLNGREIDRVECHANPDDLAHIDRVVVTTADQAKFSMQYCVGVAIEKGAVSLEDFTPEGIATANERAPSRDVRLIPDADVPRFGADVRVMLSSGGVERCELQEPRESSHRDVRRKFMSCCDRAGLVAEDAVKLRDSVLGLSEAPDFSRLTQGLLQVAHGGDDR